MKFKNKEKPNRSYRYGISMILIFLFCFSNGAYAENQKSSVEDITELNLEDLMQLEVETVYSASKFEQKITSAPSSVSIVTSEEIKKYGYRSLVEILDSVRSFYFTYDRNYDYLGVRGFGRPGDYNDHILLLIDGHRINDNIANSAAIGTEFPLDVDLIEKIEVIRGPGSSIYGSNAFFAVINVITRRGQDLKGAEISSEVGSYSTFKERFSYGNAFKDGLEIIASGSWYNSAGQNLYFSAFNQPATNNGNSNGGDFDRFQSAFLKLSYHDIEFESGYNSRTKGIPTGAFGTDFNNSNNQTEDGLFYNNLKFERSVPNNATIMVRFFYDMFNYTGDYIASSVDNKDIERGGWWGGELKYSLNLNEVQKIVLGTEYQDNIEQLQKNYDVSPYTLFLNNNTTSQFIAFYLQDEVTLSKRLLLNAGMRYDHYDTFGGTANPRVGLIYNPYDNSTFKLIYGSAFRAPNNYELYYSIQGPGEQEGNPNLSPETIKQYELVYEQYLTNRFRTSISGFYYTINDLISLTTDPSNGNLVYQNIDKINATGVELEAERKSANGIEGRWSYSYQDVRNAATNDILTNSPRQLMKILLSTPLLKNTVYGSIEEQYVSNRLTVAGDYATEYFITNLTFYSHRLLIKGLDISASVYNLFNTPYGDPGGLEQVVDIIPQDGR
ncbi:MAG: TonB-dependent receptor plug domain-containing protein, partial [Nitrospiria bacterium]